jgi:low temperature requirement protein LtrA
VILFWMYGGYAWLTNQVPPRVATRRVLLILGMGGFFVCALAIPRAFTDSGIVFGLGYLWAVLVHAGLYAEAYGRAVVRFVPANLVGAVCVVAAGATSGPVSDALWLAPIVLQVIAAVLTRRIDEQARAGFDLRPGHFVERHGLLLIVAFGESVVSIGLGIAHERLDIGSIGAAVLGLALAAALWWTYFAEDERIGETVLASASLDTRVQTALNAYFYAYIPVLLGIVALAAGVRITIGDLGARLDPGPALLLGGGVGLYLAGDVCFRLALRYRPLAFRATGALVALATVVLGIAVSGFAQLVGLVLTLVTMLAVEQSSGREDPG